ncbi:hypothetical protein PPERSA_08218 [Pseudocohnilembus persalinus]|uniref:Vacuolar protein sorting-associated protein 16 homolog n=1 Tax=Pseudocohnilembus persalinus TaxID=266149 RepID=A0A0V0QFX8_PSEPJ|nr:hypothetical protein PPERSA_08218 [Pseudocohnilembus persalinus]|eukprot:KRX01117.1 hypothetical protein PPERSA_08218 [Pseudocohnilembus persalinus]
MATQNWIQMGQDEYEFHELFRMNEDDFKQIDLKYNHVAAAKFGGPIAATQDKFLKKQYQVLNNILTKDKISFFANNGKLINSISFKPDAQIVGFNFIQDELLLVVQENWKYHLLCPNPGKNQLKTFTIPHKDQSNKIQLAKVYENGFVFQTDINTFFFIDSVYEPYKCKQFYDPEISKKQQIIKHWVIIPRQYTLSEKLELQITHHAAGIINLVEDEGFKIYYNRQYAQNFEQQSLPHLDNIVMIAPSPDYEEIVYLSQVQRGQHIQWVCSVMALNFIDKTIYQQEVPKLQQGLQIEQNDKSFLQPQQMIWCGKNCIIINTQFEFKIINQYLVKSEKNSKTKGKFLVEEVDGIRIITNRKQEILRQIPQCYISVFQQLSTDPGAMLLDQYQQLEEKQPLDYEDNFRKDTKLLEEAVQQCLEASKFELNHNRQEKLLRSAQYGKTFLEHDQFDQNLMGEICRALRVVNSLRVEKVCRTITYAQLDTLSDPVLIKLLLRYNSHYKAIQICKHLNLSQKLKQQVYIHWACQKIEQQNVSELQLCDEIFEKLQPEHVSYTEIAKKAFKIGKPSLGLKLLDFEKETAKKVPVLIWMAQQDETGEQTKKFYFENAVKESIQSKDSNMINMTLMKILDSQLSDELKFNSNPFYGNLIKQEVTILEEFMNKNDLQDKCFDQIQQYHGKPFLNEIFYMYLKQGLQQEAEKLKEQIGISDKRYHVQKIKVLIEKQEWNQIEKYLLQINKKRVLVPYEMVADLIFKIGSQDHVALNLIQKMHDINEQVSILVRIGQPQIAVEACVSSKNYTLLREIKEQIVDEQVRNNIDLYLNNQAR